MHGASSSQPDSVASTAGSPKASQQSSPPGSAPPPSAPPGAGAAPPGDAQTCKPQACAIQTCLASNDYQQARCIHAIAALIQCCDAAAAAHSGGGGAGGSGGAAAAQVPAPVHCSFSPSYRRLVARQQAAAGER